MKHIACLAILLMALTTLSCAKSERFHFIEAEEGTYVMDKETGEFYPYQMEPKNLKKT